MRLLGPVAWHPVFVAEDAGGREFVTTEDTEVVS
jgi:hypothetical protein